MWDLVHRISAVQSIASAAIASNTTTTGAAVALTGYESVSALVRVSSRTDGNYTPAIQLSNASGGTYYALDTFSYIGAVAPGAISAVGDTLIGILQMTSQAANTAGVANTALIFGEITVASLAVTTGASVQADFILGHPRHSGAAV